MQWSITGFGSADTAGTITPGNLGWQDDESAGTPKAPEVGPRELYC